MPSFLMKGELGEAEDGAELANVDLVTLWYPFILEQRKWASGASGIRVRLMRSFPDVEGCEFLGRFAGISKLWTGVSRVY